MFSENQELLYKIRIKFKKYKIIKCKNSLTNRVKLFFDGDSLRYTKTRCYRISLFDRCLLTAVRSRLGSDSSPDCHSLPRRRFATLRLHFIRHQRRSGSIPHGESNPGLRRERAEKGIFTAFCKT